MKKDLILAIGLSAITLVIWSIAYGIFVEWKEVNEKLEVACIEQERV